MSFRPVWVIWLEFVSKQQQRPYQTPQRKRLLPTTTKHHKLIPSEYKGLGNIQHLQLKFMVLKRSSSFLLSLPCPSSFPIPSCWQRRALPEPQSHSRATCVKVTYNFLISTMASFAQKAGADLLEIRRRTCPVCFSSYSALDDII